MQTKTKNTVTVLTTALCLSAGAAGAASIPAACEYRAPTAESETWDYVSEAAELFEDTERRARRIQRYSGNLSHTRVAELSSWEAHGVELAQIRDEVNALNEDLCRLARIQRVVMPRQQAVIDRIQERAANLGALTNRSIAEFNERPPAKWILPEYAEGVDRIYNEAVELEAATMSWSAFESSD